MRNIILDESTCEILATKNKRAPVFFDIPKIIAEYGTRLLWGQGYNFIHKDKQKEKAINELLRIQNMDQLFAGISTVCSLYGRAIVVIDFIGNKPRLSIADPITNSKTAEAYNEEEAAIFWYHPIQGDIRYSVRVMSDKYKNVYTPYCDGEEITLQELNLKLGPNNRVPEIWVHNLGFVPVQVFYNKAKNGWDHSNLAYRKLADCWNVRDLAQAINSQVEELIAETYMSHSRAFGDFPSDYIRKLKADGADIERALLDRLFVNTGGGDNKAPIQIQKSDFDGVERWEVIKAMFDRLIREVGYSPANDAASEKTATETLFQKSGDVETTKAKRNIMQSSISVLIAKIMVIMGLYNKEDLSKYLADGDQDWTFEIKENMVLNAIQQSEELYNMYQRNQISYYEMIAKIRDIDLEEARTVGDEILEVNNQLQADQLELMNADLAQGNGEENENSQIKDNESNE